MSNYDAQPKDLALGLASCLIQLAAGWECARRAGIFGGGTHKPKAAGQRLLSSLHPRQSKKQWRRASFGLLAGSLGHHGTSNEGQRHLNSGAGQHSRGLRARESRPRAAVHGLSTGHRDLQGWDSGPFQRIPELLPVVSPLWTAQDGSQLAGLHSPGRRPCIVIRHSPGSTEGTSLLQLPHQPGLSVTVAESCSRLLATSNSLLSSTWIVQNLRSALHQQPVAQLGTLFTCHRHR
ncbi:hypothetical protein G7046_g6853 [Stylonectria norvegica]|nr:hypothetical protein G7046_g6853 [Stylonectria norvegica]